MNNWKLFEEPSCKFLTENYSNGDVLFRSVGGSDSTLSDIEVIIDGNLKFFIESKMSGAQCGQFVLLDTNDNFIYSPRNKSIENEYSIYIMNYINRNYIDFKSVSTKSIPINLGQSIFANWIINHYLSKNVKYIITGYDLNNFIIFPLNKFNEYFNITANFRVKKSGSRDLSKIHANEAQSIINKFYKADDIYYKNNKAFIKIYNELPMNITLAGEFYNYYLVHNIDNIYHVRMLSNTFNANVIFSCNLKQNQNINDLLIFKNDVNQSSHRFTLLYNFSNYIINTIINLFSAYIFSQFFTQSCYCSNSHRVACLR